ncbi:hypothetical protein HC928_25635, partial [bacterium]|nr:hypothetical protein [bacterium]
MTTAEVLLVGVLLLFGVGVYGLLILRHYIQQIIALQILVKSTALALVTAGYVRGEPALGQSL